MIGQAEWQSLYREWTGDELLAKPEILALPDGLRYSAGVYFLIENDEIAYIGQSKKCIHSRVKSHHSCVTQYSGVRCILPDQAISLKRHFLDYIESIYIHTLNPRRNYTKKNGEKQAPISMDRFRTIVEG